MPNQTIGTVRVQVGQSSNPRVSSINYGTRSLKSANDLNLSGVSDGDVIVYEADTDSFITRPVSAVTSGLDAGTF
jgi:hypothetical protein